MNYALSNRHAKNRLQKRKDDGRFVTNYVRTKVINTRNKNRTKLKILSRLHQYAGYAAVQFTEMAAADTNGKLRVKLPVALEAFKLALCFQNGIIAPVEPVT